MVGKSQGSPRSHGAVAPEKLAELLTAAGDAPVAAADILSDVAAGAPRLPDGGVPLLPYIAWLHERVVNGAS